MIELKPRQKIFCAEYLKDLSGKEAAIRAGYSKKTANVQSCQMLKDDRIKAYLQELQAKRQERLEVDADYVLRRLVEIDKMDVRDIMHDDGTLKPIAEWPETWRTSISGFDVAELFEGGGDERILSGILKKIKWPDKLKNLELLGKHITVGAFKETVENKHSFLGPDGKPLEVELRTIYVSVGDKRDNG